jgi:hypothetical protein
MAIGSVDSLVVGMGILLELVLLGDALNGLSTDASDITSQVNPTVVKYAVVGAVMLVVVFVQMTCWSIAGARQVKRIRSACTHLGPDQGDRLVCRERARGAERASRWGTHHHPERRLAALQHTPPLGCAYRTYQGLAVRAHHVRLRVHGRPRQGDDNGIASNVKGSFDNEEHSFSKVVTGSSSTDLSQYVRAEHICILKGHVVPA